MGAAREVQEGGGALPVRHDDDVQSAVLGALVEELADAEIFALPAVALDGEVVGEEAGLVQLFEDRVEDGLNLDVIFQLGVGHEKVEVAAGRFVAAIGSAGGYFEVWKETIFVVAKNA